MMTLEQKQKAVAKLEKKMLEGLFDFLPAQDLKVGDIAWIARYARDQAFEILDRDIEF